MSDQILVEGIEFYAFHGVTDQEQFIGHRYYVDVSVTLDLKRASETDDLSHTISYSELSRLIVEVGTSNRFRLLEALAAAMSKAIFERFPGIESLTLRVGKRLPPAKIIAQNAAVQMTWHRESNP